MIGSANPFVGPRPLETGERIWGRDQEILDLDNLLAAERIVLFHSPSGAGKSSLLQAGLLPRLRNAFDVWGPTRVNLESAVNGGANRYVLSAVQGLEEAVPAELSRPLGILAGQTLADYVEHRPYRRSAPDNVLLVFDQFEEILTVDPLAIDAKQEFFSQLGELLRNPRFWALFALREDYLAPLDPYASSVPSHFRNRFRIDLLGLDEAMQAMVQAARAGGRDFPAAEFLVRDLATLKVQQPDGSFVEQTGRHVEPVQLQVVCRRLWERMRAGSSAIEVEDLERFGDADEALAGYYADSVARIGGDEIRERTIRDWFGESLMTAGVRGQVLRGVERSEGLDNEIVVQLLDTHLIRAEPRAGATWYELAHDRLIEPVRESNAAWRAEHLAEVQQSAALWERQGRPQGLLLREAELAEAERWSAAAIHVTDIEKHFLDTSREAQATAERERRQTRRIKRLAVMATIAFVLALSASLFAGWKWREAQQNWDEAQRQRIEVEKQKAEVEVQKDEAETQRQEADRRRHEAEAASQKAEEARQNEEEQRRLAEASEREAVAARNTAEIEQERAEAEKQKAETERQRAETEKQKAEEQERLAVQASAEAIREKKAADRLRLIAEAEALAVRTLSMQSDSEADLATLLALLSYRLYQQQTSGEDPDIHRAMQQAARRHGLGLEELDGHRDTIRALVVSSRRMVASASDDGRIRIGDLEETDAEPRWLSAGDLGSSPSIRSLAFDPSGEILVAGGADGSLRAWEWAQGRQLPLLAPADGRWIVESLAFHPSGELAVARSPRPGSTTEATLEIRTVDQQGIQRSVTGVSRTLRSLVFNADGSKLAAAAGLAGALVWDVAEPEEGPASYECDCDVRSVAFGEDGRLVGGSVDGRLVLWSAESDYRDVPAHAARIEALAFHPERRSILASASLDGSIRLWDIDDLDALPVIYEAGSGWVWSAVFDPDGKRLISAGSDKILRLWTTSSHELVDRLCARLPVGRRDLSPAERDKYLAGFPAIARDEKPCHEDEG